jgi:hypothetical protein
MSPIGLALLIAAILAVAAGYVWLSVRHSKFDRSYVFRCPKCGQKLRCAARQAGQPGACPRCQERCTFPAASRSLTEPSRSEVGYRLMRRQVASEAPRA